MHTFNFRGLSLNKIVAKTARGSNVGVDLINLLDKCTRNF